VDLHPETREAAHLVMFVVGGFLVGLIGLATIIIFFMDYSS
jgi:hypothetical protein